MDFYQAIGKLGLGSRLRRLSETFTADAERLYALYGVDLDPKWFPVFYVLSAAAEERSISDIAQSIGHSHASVSQIVKEMTRNHLTATSKRDTDARVTMVRLTERGNAVQARIADQYADVGQALDDLFAETQYDLWKAIEEFEFLLARKDFFARVVEARKARESRKVEIIDYAPEFQADFKRLNQEWIEAHFKMEKADYQSLDRPEEKILEPGGHILFARYAGSIVGTCALIKMDATTYELAKMAVTERARGKNIGLLLGRAIVQKARDLGAARLFLESNTRLEAAINLYYKLGFRKVTGRPSPYERSNIQMELDLSGETPIPRTPPA